MIICISQPNRYHKLLKKELERSFKNKQIEEYQGTWKLKNWRMWSSPSNIWNLRPDCIPLSKGLDLLYGPFPPSLIPKVSNFCFSFIEHPVDRIYQLYAYIELQLKLEPTNSNFIVFSNIRYKSVESFVDSILEEGKQFKVVANLGDSVLYETYYETVFQFKDLRVFDFVGFVEKMEESLLKINKILSIDLKFDSKMLPFKLPYSNYRRRDLEILLKDDIESYYKYLEMF